MSRGLHIAKGVTLPVEYVTKTAAILAQRRKGKTYTAAVIAEELFDARLPWVALDPTGAWWGLRSSADGQKAGLPVVVLGGQHGDLPLERGAGAFVADLVLDHPGWYVLDMSLLESRAAEREFAIAFATRLHRRKMQPGMDFPLHLFVDEADLFVPQEKEMKADTQVLGAFQAIVRRGGLHGLGTTLISQRPALVNKSVLTQLDLLILLRLVAGQDQDAVDKNYIARASTGEQRAELMGSLASLPVGEGWFFEPGAEPEPLFVRVKVRERRTFNSSATPKPGERRVEPKVFADVDLDELAAQMRETVERAKENDPVALKARVRELERENACRPAEVEPVEVEVEVPVEVPVFTDDDQRWLEHVAKALEGIPEQLHPIEAKLTELRDLAAQRTVQAGPVRRPGPDRKPGPDLAPRPQPRERPVPALNGDGPTLKAGARRMLQAIASRHPAPLTRAQVAVLAKLKRTGGTFGSYWSSLNVAGLIEENGDGVRLTEAGIEYVGGVSEPQTADELVEMWRGRLKAGARTMLDYLLENHDRAVPRGELAEAAGLEVTGGTFGSYLSSLRVADLIEDEGGAVRIARVIVEAL